VNKKSLNFKMGIVVFILVLGAVAISYIGVTRMNSLNEAITRLVQGNVTRTFKVRDLRELAGSLSYLE